MNKTTIPLLILELVEAIALSWLSEHYLAPSITGVRHKL